MFIQAIHNLHGLFCLCVMYECMRSSKAIISGSRLSLINCSHNKSPFQSKLYVRNIPRKTHYAFNLSHLLSFLYSDKRQRVRYKNSALLSKVYLISYNGYIKMWMKALMNKVLWRSLFNTIGLWYWNRNARHRSMMYSNINI